MQAFSFGTEFSLLLLFSSAAIFLVIIQFSFGKLFSFSLSLSLTISHLFSFSLLLSLTKISLASNVACLLPTGTRLTVYGGVQSPGTSNSAAGYR